MKNYLNIAENWLKQDPDPETRAELSALIDAARANDATAQAELAKRFESRLQFGTAGLRGRQQAGTNGMNRVLVAQAAKGLADYIVQFDRENPSIVIGYDGRKNSAIYAQDTAQIMAAAGIKTRLLPRALPTPVLAYALKHFNTSAGVMVTASHNPPEDNGYKVYLGNSNGGGQIVSPADVDIAKLIEQAAQTPINEYARSDDYETLNDDVIEQYITKTAALAQEKPCELNYVYTAMHGVGKEVLLKTLQAASLPLPHLVAEQAEPDAAFPTVAFPNPEEKGALDLAIALAKAKNAEFIIANDPDADRLAVAIADEQGNWKSLHGNTVGCYLAWYLAQKNTGKQGTMACSLVSSPALAKIAEQYGLQSEETLTGFKYIAKVDNLLFGFEEALGYLVDADKVRDKDGISAAIVFLDLVRSLKAQGKTLLDHANDFAQTFGAYVSSQISIRVDDLADIGKLMHALRHQRPEKIGAHSISQFIDHLTTNRQSDILVFMLENGSRLIARPSGTEPKIKFYLDAKGDNAEHAQTVLQQFERDVQQLLNDIQSSFQAA
ncbi:phospho-sugar mutase [Neisseriaceae bacterium B1]